MHRIAYLSELLIYMDIRMNYFFSLQLFLNYFSIPIESSFGLPFIPPMLHNEGNYICSLGQVIRWLGKEAESLGVDIFTGSPAAEVLYNKDSPTNPKVIGIATADVGISKTGELKDSYSRGMEIVGKQTLFAEGARGSCTEDLVNTYQLRKGKDPQTYGLGLKEIWRIPKDKCKPGYIQHSLGWPLTSDIYGGSFLYHMEPDLVLLGFVVGLDYANPYISPYMEFQRWKHHPAIAKHLEGGECIQYGARVINEGGLQSIPKLTFPGGALIGCTAGFLNVPKVKGTHTAMQSGIVAADSIIDQLNTKEGIDNGVEITQYEKNMEKSWVYEELNQVRNIHPSFKAGFIPGIIYSGLTSFILKGREPWTFHNTVSDADKTKPAAEFKPINYPRPDGKLSFDLLTNLTRSGTNHEHDQPPHLRIRPGMEDTPAKVSYNVYAAPESRFCPARVYEYPEPGKLVINAQNCLHCKACAIKTPKEYIKWTVPEAGGGGPAYEIM